MTFKKVLAIAATGAASVVLVACGGGNDDSESSAGGGEGTSTSAAASPGLAKAQAVVKQYSKPSEIGVDQKLAGKPPTGKTIVYLKCQVQECAEIYDGMVDGAKALGWTAKAINVGFTPEEFNKSFRAALDQRPDGIISSGFPVAVYKPLLTEANRKGIPVVAFASGDVATGMENNGLISTFNNFKQTGLYGTLVGNWIVADSGAKDAHVANFNVAAYPTLQAYVDKVDSLVTSLCSSCTSDIINVQATDIGSKLPQQVVSAIQQNPKINYVSFGFGQMASGVRPALNAAGYKDVKIVGQGAEPANLEGLRSGKEQMWAAQPTSLQGYVGLDAFARFYTKTPLEPTIDALLPTQVLTPENVPPGETYTVPGGEEHFTQLWGVASSSS